MKIAFLGDLHGRIFHAMAALIKWQKINNKKLDLIIQAGDFGAYPYPDEKMLNNKFVKQDLTELDFSRFVVGGGEINQFAEEVKTELISPVYFIRGNHEDFKWLNNLDEVDGACDVDSYGIFKHIKDGVIKKFGDMTYAFLGGAEFGAKGEGVLDMVSYTGLIETKEKIDILVTHETHYGIGLSYHGLTQGSKYITELVEKIKPQYHITAHYHHMIGPHRRHNTIHLGLNNLVLPLRGKPGRNLRAGWMAVMNTETDTLEFIKDDWLTDMNTSKSITELYKEIIK
ncbi:MAG: metallophosphoesterase [Clostridiales bacterium]|nr:metallophosphoesterase [Clostridiales bacterium]